MAGGARLTQLWKKKNFQLWTSHQHLPPMHGGGGLMSGPQYLFHSGSWLPESGSASDSQDGLFDLEVLSRYT